MNRHAHRSFAAACALLAAAGALPARAQATAAPPPPPTAAAVPAAPQTVAHGLFTDVQLHRPSGPVQQFVMWLSAEPTPSAADRQRVQSMLAVGAMVAVVPLAPFYRRLEAQDGQCTYPGGAFDNLSRHLQAYAKLPGYLLPMLAGSGSGATFAYAVLAQTPAGTFAAALSPGFCPRLVLKTPMCADNALQWRAAPRPARGIDLLAPKALPAPWTALPGAATSARPAAAALAKDIACTPAAAEAFVRSVAGATWVAATPDASSAFDAAYAKLAVKQAVLAPPPAQLADLPLVEVPSRGNGKRFAVLLSGDGGWAAIDKELAAAFAAKDLPVVGLDSLRYFWSARTPDGLTADLDRIVRFYAARWKRSEAVLIGYSQGADVLPFAINRLPPGTRASVRMSVLLGLGQKASFEFHLANWIGPSGDRPIAPEARKLSAADTLCVYGLEDRGSLCPQLAPLHVRAMGLPGDHHFGGDYPALAARILDALPR